MKNNDFDFRSIPCLSILDESRMEKLRKTCVIKKVRKKEILFRETDPVRTFFIVKEGLVKLYKTSEEGRELLIQLMEDGDHFCMAPLFLGKSFCVNAQAMEDSLLIMMDAADFKTFLTGETGLLGQKIIAALCEKVDHLSRMVEDLAFNDIEQRISRAILKMIAATHQDDNIVTLVISHNDLASMTGTVREVVSRIVQRLKKNGIVVDTGVRHLEVNKEKLISFLEQENNLIRKTSALLYSLPKCSQRGIQG